MRWCRRPSQGCELGPGLEQPESWPPLMERWRRWGISLEENVNINHCRSLWMELPPSVLVELYLKVELGWDLYRSGSFFPL